MDVVDRRGALEKACMGPRSGNDVEGDRSFRLLQTSFLAGRSTWRWWVDGGKRNASIALGIISGRRVETSG